MKGYQSQIFNPVNLNHAKDIVITPDTQFPNKFNEETDYLIDILSQELLINENSIVLDFGVGMGRVSKAVLDKFKCKVIGSDISLSMLIYATQYVNNSNNFVTCNRVSHPGVVDVCIAVFVLQHVEKPQDEIEHIFSTLKSGGHLVLVNEPHLRFVPGDWREDNSVIWFNDFFDVFKYIESKFIKEKEFPYMPKYGEKYKDHKVIIYKKP